MQSKNMEYPIMDFPRSCGMHRPLPAWIKMHPGMDFPLRPRSLVGDATEASVFFLNILISFLNLYNK